MKFAIINRVTIPVLIENEASFDELESKKWSLKIGRDAEYIKGWSEDTEDTYEFTNKRIKRISKDS